MKRKAVMDVTHLEQLSDLRADYHKKVCSNILGPREGSGGLSIVDVGRYQNSGDLATRMTALIAQPLAEIGKTGQSAHNLLRQYTASFLKDALRLLAARDDTPLIVDEAPKSLHRCSGWRPLSKLVREFETDWDLRVTVYPKSDEPAWWARRIQSRAQASLTFAR